MEFNLNTLRAGDVIYFFNKKIAIAMDNEKITYSGANIYISDVAINVHRVVRNCCNIAYRKNKSSSLVYQKNWNHMKAITFKKKQQSLDALNSNCA